MTVLQKNVLSPGGSLTPVAGRAVRRTITGANPGMRLDTGGEERSKAKA